MAFALSFPLNHIDRLNPFESRLLKKGSDTLHVVGLHALNQGDNLRWGKGSDPFFSSLPVRLCHLAKYPKSQQRKIAVHGSMMKYKSDLHGNNIGGCRPNKGINVVSL
jgi:hypothetical protein